MTERDWELLDGETLEESVQAVLEIASYYLDGPADLHRKAAQIRRVVDELMARTEIMSECWFCSQDQVVTLDPADTPTVVLPPAIGGAS